MFYDRRGNVAATFATNAPVSQRRYDGAGRLTTNRQRFHGATTTLLGSLGTPTSGIPARTRCDALGRTTATILNYTGGAPGSETDVTTLFTFDSAGQRVQKSGLFRRNSSGIGSVGLTFSARGTPFPAAAWNARRKSRDGRSMRSTSRCSGSGMFSRHDEA
jgi:YD repeat-containing protein